MCNFLLGCGWSEFFAGRPSPSTASLNHPPKPLPFPPPRSSPSSPPAAYLIRVDRGGDLPVATRLIAPAPTVGPAGRGAALAAGVKWTVLPVRGVEGRGDVSE